MNGDLVIAMMGLIAIVFTLFVFAMMSGKKPAKSIPKPQGPTEEELLLAMSNTELLREIVRNQRQMLVVIEKHKSSKRAWSIRFPQRV